VTCNTPIETTTVDFYNIGYFKEYFWMFTGTSTHSTTSPNSYLKNLYGLGDGWSFMFSSIQDGKVLHLADGRSFEIVFGSTVSNLKDHNLTDIQLAQENGTFSHFGTSYSYTHILNYKDGKKEYFRSDGRLVGVRDKYNNTIGFTYSTLNSQPHIVITDTLNRVTTISSSGIISGSRIVTVELPEMITLSYTIINNTSPTTVSLLAAYADPIEITTNYSYSIESGGFNVWDKNTTSATNYFVNLTAITHPTDARTEFEWESTEKNLGSNGLQLNC